MKDNIELEYQETLDYLYSFIDYSLTRAFRNAPEKFNLERMNSFLTIIGNPQFDFKVVHVAGTKGKGSTSALIASALQEAGYRVGFYTSPHLQEYTERIQVNCEEISKEEFVDLVNEIRPAIEKAPEITTFELTTALGFLYFSRKKVDVAVIEVGLGGRLDATNVVSPLVSVITSLSLDHVHILGDTLAKIAFEKGGIIKQGHPVVSSPQKEEARLVLEKLSAERDAKMVQVGRDYFFSPWSHSLSGQSLLVWAADEQEMVDDFIESGGRHHWEPMRLFIPLLGYHQVENAATAYAALQVIRQNGMEIKEEAIKNGFAKVVWPGRFEILRRNPPLIVDSAHNRDSASKLRLALEDYLPEEPVIMVFGASEDKDIYGMFAELLPRVQRVIATQSVHPRAIEPETIVELAHQFGRPAQTIVPVEDALEEALHLAGNDYAVLVTGSLFISAAAREIWFNKLEKKQVIH